MSKQVAKTESKEVSENVMDFGSFGTDNIITQDLRIPKVLLMQAMSEWVTDGSARPGEFRGSFEKELLGDAKNPLKIIPFFNTNVWIMTKKVNGKQSFHAIEDRKGSDIRRDYNFVHEDGSEGTQAKAMNLFFLIKGGNLKVPFMTSFKNFSFKYAAQPYVDKLTLLIAEGKSPANLEWNLGVNMEKNDKGTFFVCTMEVAKDKDGKDIQNSHVEVKAAYEAFQVISTAFKEGANVDMGDAEEPSTARKHNF